MAVPLEELHYHVADDAALPQRRSAPSPRIAAADDSEPESPGSSFTSDEAAARFYLDELLQRDERPAMRSIVEPERAERVPSLVLKSEQDLKALGTHQVRFELTHRSIPVFGAGAVVELGPDRDLVSVSALLAEVGGVDPVESLSRAEALQRVAEHTGTALPPDAGVGAKLMFYQAEGAEAWHLVWFLPELPAAPAAAVSGTDEYRGHGLGSRPVPVSVNYLVDAHDGQILFRYSATPTGSPLPAPTKCTGTDEDEAEQTFFGRLTAAAGTDCEMDDPWRSVRTYDINFADIFDNPPVPSTAVQAPTSEFGTSNRAAVSAHLNACRVFDFYKLVLQRDSIDDLGMALISMVNTTASGYGVAPVLKNAFWTARKMWYGQIRNENGRLVSLSRHLDVIGHELTHGVIETTSNLVYATQSGALNESFADVAGVIINNWYTAPDPDDVDTWNWEIGAGLGPGSEPLRHFADPASLGDPDHMNKFRRLRPGELPDGRANDYGYVHSNSNIHNKAVHHLLTMRDDGARVFTVRDVAVLTYLGMARLTPQATFSAALRAIVDVARTYFGGSPTRDAKVAAIRSAYGLVGIT